MGISAAWTSNKHLVSATAAIGMVGVLTGCVSTAGSLNSSPSNGSDSKIVGLCRSGTAVHAIANNGDVYAITAAGYNPSTAKDWATGTAHLQKNRLQVDFVFAPAFMGNLYGQPSGFSHGLQFTGSNGPLPENLSSDYPFRDAAVRATKAMTDQTPLVDCRYDVNALTPYTPVFGPPYSSIGIIRELNVFRGALVPQ